MNPKIAQTVVQYVQMSTALIGKLNEKIASLEANQTTSETETGVQKVAAEVLSSKDVEATVSRMVTAGMLKEADQKSVQDSISKNPAFLLAMLNKVAEDALKPKIVRLGTPVSTDTSIGSDKTASDKVRKSDSAYESFFGQK